MATKKNSRVKAKDSVAISPRYSTRNTDECIRYLVWMAIEGGVVVRDILRNLRGRPAIKAFGRWLAGDCGAEEIPKHKRSELLITARSAVVCWWFQRDNEIVSKLGEAACGRPIESKGFTIPAEAYQNSVRIGQWSSDLVGPGPIAEVCWRTAALHFAPAWMNFISHFHASGFSLNAHNELRIMQEEAVRVAAVKADPKTLLVSLRAGIKYRWWSLPEDPNNLSFFLESIAPWVRDPSKKVVRKCGLDLSQLGRVELQVLVDIGYTDAAFELGKQGKPCFSAQSVDLIPDEIRESWTNGVAEYMRGMFEVPPGRRVTSQQLRQATSCYSRSMFMFLAMLGKFQLEGVVVVGKDNFFSRGKLVDAWSGFETIIPDRITWKHAIEFVNSKWNSPGAKYSL